jgi:hypothetical protein
VGSLLERIVFTGGQFVAGYQPPAQLVTVAAGCALLAAALVLVVRTAERDRLRRAAVPAAVGVAIVAVPILLAPLGFDQVYTRYLAPAHVPLLIALAAGLGWASRRPARALVAALAAFGVLVTVATAGDPKFGHQDWRAAFGALGHSPEPRVVVLANRYGYDVLPLLRPGARPLREDEPVREIVALSLPPSYRRMGRAPEPPRPPTLPAPPGFRLVERRLAATFTLLRYRASRPATPAEADLERLDLLEGGDPPLVWSLPPEPVG